MIEKLKNKVCLIITLSISALLIGIILIFAILNYNNTLNAITSMLDRFNNFPRETNSIEERLEIYSYIISDGKIEEILIVSIIFLVIGVGLGALVSKDVGNMLLQNEIEETKAAQEEVSSNFGGKNFGDNSKFNGMVEVKEIDSMEAIVDYQVILQLLGIGIILTLCSSLASMISIQKFSPLTILKERS